jgi:pyruvate dehydrogenase E1 component beta subunit
MTGSGFGNGGQHSDYLEAWFAHTAGMKVVAPSNPADAYGLLRSCIDDPDPCLFIENLPGYWAMGEAAPPNHRVPIGQARIVREGTEVTVISYSRTLTEAISALNLTDAAGISVELIDLRSISPWDEKTVTASAAKTGRVLIVHEAVTKFGVGAEISATLSQTLFGKLKKPVMRLGAPYAPVPFSKPLETAYAPDAERIAGAVKSLVARG